MKAVVRKRYGSPDVVELREVEEPELTDDDGILVRVRAAGVNRYDFYSLGRPLFVRVMFGIPKPKRPVLGVDFAGTVAAVGKSVDGFAPGDEVFGAKSGAFAEYVCAGDGLARKPSNVTFEEAAVVPMAGTTALQGLRDKAEVRPGQKVLVNGASGGVGTFAVQIAKALGAEVTAVCSTRNVELARSLGADDVVDYTRDDFTRSGRRYDTIFDVAGSRSWSEYRRALEPDGKLIMAGAPKGGPVLGPLRHIVAVRLASAPSDQDAVFFGATYNRSDMAALGELLETGKMKPVVERRYELREAADALRYMGDGHVQGKLVIAV